MIFFLSSLLNETDEQEGLELHPAKKMSLFSVVTGNIKYLWRTII